MTIVVTGLIFVRGAPTGDRPPTPSASLTIAKQPSSKTGFMSDEHALTLRQIDQPAATSTRSKTRSSA
jgi:hypothetical protein